MSVRIDARRPNCGVNKFGDLVEMSTISELLVVGHHIWFRLINRPSQSDNFNFKLSINILSACKLVICLKKSLILHNVSFSMEEQVSKWYYFLDLFIDDT